MQGPDARSKKVAPTAKAKGIVDRLAAEWRATEAAIGEIEAEIPYPLSRVVTDIEEALHRKSFHDSIAEKLAADDAWARPTPSSISVLCARHAHSDGCGPVARSPSSAAR
jgi:hypothetical protein